MAKQLGVLMDSIAGIHYKKDSTLAMLFEAQKRGYTIYYFEQKDVFLRDGVVQAHAQILKLYHNSQKWFEFERSQQIPLSMLDIILMRKDPTFNLEYIYTTYLLEHAERSGVVIVNKPQSLRDANEKMFTSWFPECCPKTLVTSSIDLLRAFFMEHQDIVCKPLEGMGGTSIFRLQYPDMNASVVFEVLTHQGSSFMMAQQFIPAINQGDKRILLINGKPIPYALARIPAAGELRGNLAAGGSGVAQPLTARDYWICEQVAPILREKGLIFVGLDVIGDYLTEINVTSPTCIRELDEQCGLNISETLFDSLESL